MKLLCVIPVRKGSKRLERKNFRLFQGKPMFKYSVEAAVNSNLFDRIVISTDEEYFAEDHLSDVDQSRLQVWNRPSELGADNATIWDVMNNVLDQQHTSYDYVYLLLPTSPMRTAQHLIESAALLEKEQCDALVSVTHFLNVVDLALQPDEGGKRMERVWPHNVGKNGHEFTEKFKDNGAIYAMKEEFYRKVELFPPDTVPYFMKTWESMDVDTIDDFELANAIYEYFMTKKNKD